MRFLEERNSALNKSLGISSNVAQDFAEKLRGLNIQFGDEKLFKFAANINKLTGGFATTSKITKNALTDQAKFQGYMTENLQLSEEAANSYALYAAGVGTSGLDAIAQQNALAKILGDSTGVDQLTAQRMITDEIAGLSSDIRQQYAGMPGELETAVLKSKLLGVSLQQLYDIGKNTLQIEQAVGNEIELQLLSGRKLEVQGGKNFMAEYRKAMLTSDVNKQQQLLTDMISREGETLKTNFMYREKMAQTLGMSTDQLMKSVEKVNLANQLGLQDIANLSFDELKGRMKELSKTYDPAKLDEFLKASDTRTKSEQYLESIDAKISGTILSRSKAVQQQDKDGKLMFDDKGNPIMKRQIDVANKEGITQLEKMSKAVLDFSDQITLPGVTDAMAALDLFGRAIGSITDPIAPTLENIPGTGKMSGLVTTTKRTLISAEQGSMPGAASHRDAILFDPKDEVVTVASTDRGQLENTVNTMMTGNTTNNTNISIDYNAMANAIAAAMTRVKLNINESNNYRSTFNA